jgi:TonB family protein
MSFVYYHSPVLPWTMSEEEEQRFRRWLKRALLVCLILSLIIAFLPVPQIDRAREEEVPPRLAKLLLERQPPPPPPVVKKPEPEAPKAETPKKAEPKPKTEQPKPTKSIEAARAKAERSGLLAFKDDLADLRTNPVTANVTNTQPLTKGGPATGPAKPVERSLITSNVAGGSGGINTAKLSRDTGGGGLGGRATTSMASPVGGGAGGGGGGGAGGRGAGGGGAGRSIEEIKLVFDRNKGSIYAIYNRALRSDPTLQGKVVLKLTIAPSGQVTDLQIVSSELKNTDLERKLLARIKQFNFGAKDVAIMVVTYPIDFLPS